MCSSPGLPGRSTSRPGPRPVALWFTLVGARLDHVAGRPAAVIVYRVRAHEINLFVSRSAATEPRPVTVSKPRGFAVAAWAEDGLAFAAISDIDAQELVRFADLVRSPTP